MLWEIIDWSAALVPVLLLLGLFVWLDVFKLMTFWEVLVLVLLGGATALVAYPISGRMLDTLPIGFSTYSRFVAPWIEEALKAIVAVGLFAFNRIGLKLDAVISGFAVGAGFSLVENIIYLWRFPELSVDVWMVRGLGTAVMHGTTLAIVAVVAHQLSERAEHGQAAEFRLSPLWFVPGLLIAIAIHTLFNQFPDQPLLAMMGTLIFAPLTLMAIFRWGEQEAMPLLETEREEHKAALATLRSGRFPDSNSGRLIAKLASRCDAETAERIREYCEVKTWLLLCEEEALVEQAADTHHRVHVKARDGFKRLTEIKRALGRSTFAALKPLLPFSRSDEWELHELHHRVRGPSE